MKSLRTVKHPQEMSHCYKNWSDSSSAMAVDIILEGFEQAEREHGVP